MKKFIWNTYLELLDKDYSMFFVNKKYKDRSFKNNEEYLIAQEKLANEIDKLNEEIFRSIKSVISEFYPEIELMIYDSRLFSKNEMMIGTILTKNIKTKSETFDVKACFEKFTGIKIKVERYEDLLAEDKLIIDKVLKEKNGQI